MGVNAARQSVQIQSAIGIIGQYRAARAQIRRASQTISPTLLYIRLKEHFGNEEGYSAQQTRALATRAIAMAEQAQLVNRSGDRIVPGNTLPLDPALTGAPERFRYAILVEGYDRNGGRIAFATEVLSDNPMTRAQLNEYAIANIDRLPVFRRSKSPDVVTDGSQPMPTVTVLSAGRRP